MLLLITFTFIRCEPDLVDEPPLGPVEQNFFNNVVEFRQNMASVYAELYDYYHFAAPQFNYAGWVTGTWLLPGDDLTVNKRISERSGTVLTAVTTNQRTAHRRVV